MFSMLNICWWEAVITHFMRCLLLKEIRGPGRRHAFKSAMGITASIAQEPGRRFPSPVWTDKLGLQIMPKNKLPTLCRLQRIYENLKNLLSGTRFTRIQQSSSVCIWAHHSTFPNPAVPQTPIVVFVDVYRCLSGSSKLPDEHRIWAYLSISKSSVDLEAIFQDKRRWTPIYQNEQG